jgi:predicted transcriptional regulator
MATTEMNALLDAVAAKANIEERGAQAEIGRFLGVTEPFVSKCIKRGYFPVDRARALSDEYGVPFVGLTKPALRPHFNQA